MKYVDAAIVSFVIVAGAVSLAATISYALIRDVWGDL